MLSWRTCVESTVELWRRRGRTGYVLLFPVWYYGLDINPADPDRLLPFCFVLAAFDQSAGDGENEGRARKEEILSGTGGTERKGKLSLPFKGCLFQSFIIATLPHIICLADALSGVNYTAKKLVAIYLINWMYIIK